jgi:hypothetical protein
VRTGILLLALVVGGHSTAVAQVEEVPVEFSSLNSTWASKGFFRGRAEVHPDSVIVVFDSVYIELASEETLDSVTVGLASFIEDDRWRIDSTAPAWVPPHSLAKRSHSPPGEMRAAIERSTNAPLRDSWLVVTFHSIGSGEGLPPGVRVAPSTSYTHSSRRLFAAVEH